MKSADGILMIVELAICKVLLWWKSGCSELPSGHRTQTFNTFEGFKEPLVIGLLLKCPAVALYVHKNLTIEN